MTIVHCYGVDDNKRVHMIEIDIASGKVTSQKDITDSKHMYKHIQLVMVMIEVMGALHNRGVIKRLFE